MKILQVTPFFSPVMGGSAEVPYQISKKLAQRGHQVTVYTSDYKLTREYIDAAPGVTVQPFKTWSSVANFYITPEIIKAAREEVRNFDVVHMHNYRTFQNIVLHHYTKKYGVPYILHAYGGAPRVMSKLKMKLLYDYLWGYGILKDASRIIAALPNEVEQYVDMGIDKSKMTQIPNNINIDEYEQLPKKNTFRQKYGITEEHMVLFLGRIHKIKGIDILVKGVAELIREGKSIRLVIIGPDDGYLPTLMELIRDLKIEENVTITGFVPAEMKKAAYVDADVYVLPSVYESFPTTVLEAAACGTPVIVMESCQIAYIVKDTFGLVVPNDEHRLRDALLNILTDKNMRNKFGETGRVTVRENYTWSRNVEKVETVYKEVIKKK
jgi:glycosyltransferase involved in cell wall biosynthesis